ncbi:hypothetical protein N7454_003502 [Penicillium verhagenii]|nr:hypothetical protein N7454_003502 [Penicillium verhagenii]
MDQEEAPPPYAAVDPLVTPTINTNNTVQQTSGSLRENVRESPAAGTSRIADLPPSTSPAITPIHFTSAAAYFEERPPLVSDDSRSILHHHLTIYPRSQAKDFPRRPRCWAARRNEIPQQDWDTFLRYLFPPQLGLAAASQHLPRQLRAEIQRDRKDRPQETDEQRQARIAAVVDEWNQCFFEPRATSISFVYIGEPDAAPSSALCPFCYPAATKATRGTGAPASTDGQSPWSSNTPSPVPGQYTPPSTAWPYAPAAPYGLPLGSMPYGTPYGVPPFPVHGVNNQLPGPYPPQHPPSGVAPWQWNNNWAYSQPQNENTGTSKGAFGWFSNITAQAQKYGDRFAEQAQRYGDQISSQAMHYGRQVEEQALAHGRWVEEQARFGRKPGAYPPIGYAQPNWPGSQANGTLYNAPTPPTQPSSTELPVSPSPLDLPVQPTVTATTSTQSPAQSQTSPQIQTQEARSQTQNQNDRKFDHKYESQDDPRDAPRSPPKDSPRNTTRNVIRGLPRETPSEKLLVEQPRRLSVGSASSESSLSSFDSLSTTSDLDASDLATVRIQLQSLHNQHDRTLYDAAADLRQQLNVLQASRREARFSGRSNWRPGAKSQAQQTQRPGNSDWGRWDSPEQQQRQVNDQRALKEELRSTKQAFRDVVRRARNEQHSRKQARKNLKHQHHGHGRQQYSMDDGKKKDKGVLTGAMGRLALNESQQAPLPRAQAAPAVHESYSFATTAPLHTHTSSGISTSSSNTPSSSQASMHALPTEPPAPDRQAKLAPPTRLRDKLKPRIAKKLQKSDSSSESRHESDKKSSSKKPKD